MVGVVRPIEVGAIARRQEAAEPDVELRRERELSGRVEHFDVVLTAVVLGVEHDLDLVGDRAVDVEANAVEQNASVPSASSGSV
jgi:hypothetical protein